MPLKHQSLPELLADLDNNNRTNPVASYTFHNTYFMDNMKLSERDEEVCSLWQGHLRSPLYLRFLSFSCIIPR